MNLDPLSSKQIGELEQLASQLLSAMRKAKLNEEEIYAQIQELEQELGKARRARFDAKNSEYSNY